MPIVTIPALGAIGLIKDQPAQEMPPNAWTDADNVRFLEQSAQRFLGDVPLFAAPAVTPYHVQPYATPGAQYIVHAGLAAVYADDGTTRTNLTGTAIPSGLIDDRWSGGTLNGVLVMNNGVNAPSYWGGTGTLATLPGWPVGCKAESLRPFKNYLVALGVTKGAAKFPHMVKWSGAADPGTVPATWNEADPANDAGELDLAETTDLMVDALPLGGVLILYKQRSMYAMNYIGGQYIFQFTRLPGDHGAMARGCIAATPMGHVVLTQGDLVLHNGQGATSIIDGKMRRWLFTVMNSLMHRRCFVVANAPRNEVWVCFPEANQTTCTRALVWNWKDSTFCTRSLGSVTYGCAAAITAAVDASWSGDAGAWDADPSAWDEVLVPPAESRLVLASASPRILMADSGTDFAGVTFTASLERTGLAFDAPALVKTVRAVYPRIDGTTGSTLQIQVGAAMDAEAPYTWSAPVTYTVGSTFKADTFATGRFIGLRISSTASAAWRIRSLDMDVVMRGAY